MKAFQFKLVASVISLSIAAVTAPAFAQSADEADGVDDGEIVVTAQRRSEKSVDVPAPHKTTGE